MLKIACIGGYGHSEMVLNDLASIQSGLDIHGIYEAYPGESFQAGIEGHFLLQGAVRRPLEELPDISYEKETRGVAVIGTRLDLLSETAIFAAKRGWHLIMEKPLAFNRRDLGALHEAVRLSNRRIMPMLTMRNRPAFQRAKEIVESGDIGEIGLISVRKSYKWGERPDWFGDSACYPGSIPWVGIHALDIAHHITGQRIKAISAQSANRFHLNYPACEDIGVFHFQCENGALGAASIDYLRPESAPTHGDDWCRISGQHGMLEVNASQQTLNGFSASKTFAEDFSDNALLPIFSNFVQSLGSARHPDEDIGFHLTEACLAAMESQQTGKSIPLEPDFWRLRD